ncbi:unnamed protein product [Rotaria magnacalcarata]|uniref:Uncharacterized protein n=1 Tax=Rotaria magnacalcarata TaxID=392030 RepID=A0A816AHB8_9BILA|nr:unnamed protein product [Rotaria magnacalcarata]CAF2084763.1 unnamed protein product [Rotaria magnacalcarata]CAF2105007.1 unnamed protein product [Rotaria magnacalcarata]CAF2206427.1 unnamed protein product [Rotaria magnacalcarata]
MAIVTPDKNRLAFDFARKTFQLDQLIKQTPFHMMTPIQVQQFTNLSTEISALQNELYHLMIMDNDL